MTAACTESGDDPSPAGAVSTYLIDDDMTIWLYDCLVEAGLNPVLQLDTPYGAVIASNTFTEADLNLHRATFSDCEARSREEGVARPLNYVKTEADWAAEYDRRIEAHSCLQDAGYNVEDLPSLAVYVEGDGIWSPHTVPLLGLGLIEAEQLFYECRQ
ncbi:MAG: hypothetical protein GXP35_16740 [Actinobacteria bacterium]|nr:hypothetical protein [Actinomycetota bacterium]